MFYFEKGNIRFIRGGRYPACNSVFIDDEIRAVIDPASNESTLLAIDRERPIQVLINSHCHEDHFLFNSRFPDAALWVPSREANGFRSMEAFLEQFYEPGTIDQKARTAWESFFTDVVQFQPREPDRLLDDGDVLVFGETRAQVLHTPGHSAGSICLYDKESGILISGDTLFRDGVGRSDGPDADPHALESSLSRLSSLPPETVVFPGHGARTTIGRELSP